MKTRIIFLLFFLLYQTSSYSKNIILDKYNQKYLSDYFSANLSYENQNNVIAIDFFESSKNLLKGNESYFDKYLKTLVLEEKISKAIRVLKKLYNTKNNSLSFDSNLLLVIENLKLKKYNNAEKELKKINKLKDIGNFEYIIYSTLEDYVYLFNNKKIKTNSENYGNLSLINKALQHCYINSEKTNGYFLNLLNAEEGDFARYNFFYLSYLIQNKNYSLANKISSNLDYLNTSLLVSQAKEWVDTKNYDLFSDYFKCNSENDLMSEFFFLISNLYSSQNEFKKSNFYLNISNFLNPKFYFNNTLGVENYYANNRFIEAKNYLNKIKKKNQIYNWYKIKQETKIISKLENDGEAIEYIEKKFSSIQNPTNKMIYDMANYYKNKKNYKLAIKKYTEVLNNISKDSIIYSNVLYRRGASFERLERYKESDSDLLNALKINPEDSYILNYIGYSWLERNYKIDEAIKMLKEAHRLNENDPYIIDSIGWGYYLIEDFIKAESYMIQAVQLMPLDPVVNDHYGDILWKLNRKLEAKYFWKNTLDLDETDEEMRINIHIKLLKGIPSS